MSSADVAQVVSAAAATSAAVFAAVSALMSRAAVERGNLAFVWPEYWIDGPDQNLTNHRLRVRLHSDGAGIALDARWSVFYMPDEGRKASRRAEQEAAEAATSLVRVLRPGECSPSSAAPADERPIHPDLFDEPYAVVVRWSDSAGRRWEFNEGSLERQLARKPTRVRRARW